ncbi:hypothetical protein OH786_28585 [Streptomyces atratus]|uniref:hypothetical protein n=1 Tax=Streptomyces atratus TaxID=1893 RepID=UPI00210A2362|nr:hypothetical protein [Streptomyces atratus]
MPVDQLHDIHCLLRLRPGETRSRGTQGSAHSDLGRPGERRTASRGGLRLRRPGPARAHQAAAPVEEYDISLLTGDVVHYTDGAGKQDTVTVDRPDGATVTALGADPGGRPHPYRMALAGPGAQVRLLDTLAPAIEADLAAVREDRRAPGGPGTPGLPVTNG